MTHYAPNDLEIWAGRVIACGWSAIPIRAREKVPAVKWQRWHTERQVDADWDAMDAYIREWWGGPRPYGLGIVTGRGSALIVVDLDDAAAVELVERTCGGWPRTVEVATPRGRHLYFGRPERGDYPNRVKVEGCALDARGDGGYVLAPPSLHPSGEPYKWVNSPLNVFPLATLPDALRLLLWPERAEIPRVQPSPIRRPTAYVEAALTSACERVKTAPGGMRNDTLNREAHSVFRFVRMGELEVRRACDALEAAAVAAGLARVEARRTLASALDARMSGAA